ncbi:MAG: ABC transporter permease [Candidatus Aminicenantales bacterium]
MINLVAVYVLWLREMKRYFRAKSRILGSLAVPFFFLAFLGLGFSRMTVPGVTQSVGYIKYLVPGIIGMSLLFQSIFAGLSVLWDREFGFLKEIMVAPVSRVSIVLGRIAGGMTAALIQGILVMIVSLLVGFRVRSVPGLLASLVFMVLISTSFIGLGLLFASRMKDMQGYSIIMNFVVFPLFFLSGALYPLDNLPTWLRLLSHLDPLTYGVDGLRGALLGISTRSIPLNLLVMGAISALMVFLGAWSFERGESA